MGVTVTFFLDIFWKKDKSGNRSSWQLEWGIPGCFLYKTPQSTNWLQRAKYQKLYNNSIDKMRNWQWHFSHFGETVFISSIINYNYKQKYFYYKNAFFSTNYNSVSMTLVFHKNYQFGVFLTPNTQPPFAKPNDNNYN